MQKQKLLQLDKIQAGPTSVMTESEATNIVQKQSKIIMGSRAGLLVQSPKVPKKLNLVLGPQGGAGVKDKTGNGVVSWCGKVVEDVLHSRR